MDLWSELFAFIGGLVSGWTLKVYVSSRSSRNNSTTIVTQSGNTVGGDIVGGDKKE